MFVLEERCGKSQLSAVHREREGERERGRERERARERERERAREGEREREIVRNDTGEVLLGTKLERFCSKRDAGNHNCPRCKVPHWARMSRPASRVRHSRSLLPA